MSAMRDETPDGRDSVLDGVDIHTVISGTERIAETVTDVIDAEGSVEGVSSAGGTAFVAWLFQEDAAPRQVGLEELPMLAADDAYFVWVDLNGYVPSDLAQVAKQLVLSSETVRTHVRNAMSKLGAATRAHAVALALQRGEITP